MIRQFKNQVWKILNLTDIGPMLQLYMVGHIRDLGWMKTFKTKKAIDNQGNPIPWFTYPFTLFLEPRLQKTLVVFEYGCGNSTNWFAERTGKITSVEDNKQWLDFVSQNLRDNASLIYCKTDSEYINAITETEQADIIIIDGKLRNECLDISSLNLTNSGVIILDDSQREEYRESVEKLLTIGFKRLDFWGIHPVTPHKTCTSVFYRTNNCLDI